MAGNTVRDGSSWHYDGMGNLVPDVMDDFGNRIENVDRDYDALGNETYSTDDFGSGIVGEDDVADWPL